MNENYKNEESGAAPAGDSEDILRDVDPSRREVLRSILVNAAVATPIVSSFSIKGLGLNEAFAQDDTPPATVLCRSLFGDGQKTFTVPNPPGCRGSLTEV